MPGDVRVKVLAAGVSLPDVLAREGVHPAECSRSNTQTSPNTSFFASSELDFGMTSCPVARSGRFQTGYSVTYRLATDPGADRADGFPSEFKLGGQIRPFVGRLPLAD
jgi:hypothetical protein